MPLIPSYPLEGRILNGPVGTVIRSRFVWTRATIKTARSGVDAVAAPARPRARDPAGRSAGGNVRALALDRSQGGVQTMPVGLTQRRIGSSDVRTPKPDRPAHRDRPPCGCRGTTGGLLRCHAARGGLRLDVHLHTPLTRCRQRPLCATGTLVVTRTPQSREQHNRGGRRRHSCRLFFQRPRLELAQVLAGHALRWYERRGSAMVGWCMQSSRTCPTKQNHKSDRTRDNEKASIGAVHWCRAATYGHVRPRCAC